MAEACSLPDSTAISSDSAKIMFFIDKTRRYAVFCNNVSRYRRMKDTCVKDIHPSHCQSMCYKRYPFSLQYAAFQLAVCLLSDGKKAWGLS